MKVATFIKRLPKWTGDARLFALSEPITFIQQTRMFAETSFVVVSSTIVKSDDGMEPETCVFPCDENGDVLSWTELQGSFIGGIDHQKALFGLGFYVSAEEPEALEMNFEEWIRIGVLNGFCSLPFCSTHGDWPMHSSEIDAIEAGDDPCQVIMRLGEPDDWAVS